MGERALRAMSALPTALPCGIAPLQSLATDPETRRVWGRAGGRRGHRPAGGAIQTDVVIRTVTPLA